MVYMYVYNITHNVHTECVQSNSKHIILPGAERSTALVKTSCLEITDGIGATNSRGYGIAIEEPPTHNVMLKCNNLCSYCSSWWLE